MKILLITLSNIGDAVLTLPVLDALYKGFDKAQIDVLLTANVKEIFEYDSRVNKIIISNKKESLLKRLNIIKEKGARQYDLVIDLKNTFLSHLLFAKKCSSFLRKRIKEHKIYEHLLVLKAFSINTQNVSFDIKITDEDILKVNDLLKDYDRKDDYIVISPGSKTHLKRWSKENYAELSAKIFNHLAKGIVIVGDNADESFESSDTFIANYINKQSGVHVCNLSGKTNLRELAYIIENAKAIVANDSAPVHFASAVNIPTVAIFGPTEANKYGPLADNSVVLQSQRECTPCKKHQCQEDVVCLKDISVDEVYNALKKVLV